MQLRAKTWLRFCLYSQLVIIPLGVVVGLGVFGVIHVSWSIASFVVLFGFGAAGGVLRLLNVTGRVTLVFTQEDLNSWMLRFWYKIESGFLADIAGSNVILEDGDIEQRR